jgi:hypothetical protein
MGCDDDPSLSSRRMMSRAMVVNAFSTLMLLFADVSKNSIHQPQPIPPPPHLNAKFIRQSLAPLGRHDPLVRHVALVADEHLVDVVRRVLLDLAHPVADVWPRVRRRGGGLLEKEASSVTSYTRSMPMAPL